MGWSRDGGRGMGNSLFFVFIHCFSKRQSISVKVCKRVNAKEKQIVTDSIILRRGSPLRPIAISLAERL
jgi:hypothetical protein